MSGGEIRQHFSFLECASGNSAIRGIGTVRPLTTTTVMTIDNVFHVPEYTVNLVRLIKLEDKGVRWYFDNGI